MLFKAGFQPSCVQRRDGTGVSVMPLGSASAASSSIFDDQSHDQENDVEFKMPMRGAASLAAPTSDALSHCCITAPALLPPKKFESLFQDEQDVDDL